MYLISYTCTYYCHNIRVFETASGLTDIVQISQFCMLSFQNRDGQPGDVVDQRAPDKEVTSLFSAYCLEAGRWKL